MSRWFRMYDDALDDPKVQLLAPELFKAWVNLLCLASRGGGKLPCLDDLAFSLRVTRDVARDWIETLRQRGLIDVDEGDGALSPHNWSQRQFRSDADPRAAERQRRKRAKEASEKKTTVTRDVTPPRDRTETETETDNTEAKASVVDAGAVDPSVVEIDRTKAKRAAALRRFGEWWNDLAGNLGLAQIDAIKAGSAREKAAWTRCREWLDDHDGIDGMLDLLTARIRGSPWLRGDKDFGLSFDWLTTPTNYQKIVEGNYENRQAQRR